MSNSTYERKALLSKPGSPELKEAGSSLSDHEWSSSYSSRSSFSEGTNSDNDYIPDWDEFVQVDGNLFYIEYNSNNSASAKQQASENTLNTLNAARNNFNRTSTRRSKKSGSKLSKLIPRKKLAFSQNDKSGPATSAENTKVKFSEIAEGEIKEITLYIDPSMRHKFGRRTSLAEAILGVSISAFPDGNRCMIAGYMPNSYLSQEKMIKIGDWLKLINNEEVSMKNIDQKLMSFDEPTEIKLSLQRMSGEIEPVQNLQNQLNKITNFQEFLDNAGEIFGSPIDSVSDEMPFSILYLTMFGLEVNGPEGQDVLFAYPPKDKNCLYTSRGTFLTLNSLLDTIYNASPVITTVQYKTHLYNVAYKRFGDDLMLIAISSKYATLPETKLKSIEITRFMEFLYQSIPKSICYRRQWTEQFAMISLLYKLRKPGTFVAFEQSLPEPHYVALPKEAQLRIDDALGEMEAMDYREWNDEPLKSHREFYIIGSCLYFKSYLLATHIPPSDLLDVQCTLKNLGIFGLLEGTQNVRELVVWHDIYPKSVDRGLSNANNDSIYSTPKGRWFLAVVARYNLLLAVILESKHDTSDRSMPISPSPFYIEEIQDTLEHLRTGGIENLANTWIHSNKRPQVIKEKSDEAKEATGHQLSVNDNAAQGNSNKKTEIISILKRRTNSLENMANDSKLLTPTTSTSIAGSVNSATFSEESNHDESDSDWDGFPDSQRSSSGFDMSDMTETLLKEVCDVIPSKLTTGIDNVLYYYVQVEVGEGVLLAPTSISSGDAIIHSFRQACLLIHAVLQNTIRFRYLLALETSKPNSHRSLVAIKEHGILITVDSTEFWVIGRLFSMPSKELYVCHRADVPQNLVELAFRLSLNSAG